ncbi:hypothetical protein SAMN05443579_101209 [Variovorax sp. PDC80]|uniref:hypothetical protein n=1 Tax=Variovorax sp. PDC80 TaxID=1882827 RepID=UPI0008E42AE0|nr:hypothetical protein [Variovorax sp. PDC80]SFN99697.1 hypothetical protein SAMN05443579_101209 [Variovorax sp. PDC80]
MKPEAQPVHRQDSRQAKAALGATATARCHGRRAAPTNTAGTVRILLPSMAVPNVSETLPSIGAGFGAA